MPRAAKPQKLETLRHTKIGVSVDLCFDKNSASFLFELAGRTYSAKSMDELRTLAWREIEKLYDIEWIPVIEVTRLKPFCYDGADFVGFTQDRFYIAQKQDGAWIQRSWESDDYLDDGRNRLSIATHYADSRFSLYKDAESRHDSRTFVIDYSEAAWKALGHISSQIGVLRDTLSNLLMTKQGVKKLETMPLGKFLESGNTK